MNIDAFRLRALAAGLGAHRRALAEGLNMPARALAEGLNMPARALAAQMRCFAVRSPALVAGERVFTVGAGAALAVFTLAFSLLLTAAPAHAESTQSWVDMKFSGDKVSYVMKTHVSSEYTSTKSLCASYKSATSSSAGANGEITRIELEQYNGMEVCVIEGNLTVNSMIETSTDETYGFSVARDGKNLKLESDRSEYSEHSAIEYRITFDGGIISSTGGKVEGNTFVVSADTFEVVGDPNGSANIISGDNKADDLAGDFSSNSSGNNALLYAFIAAAVVLIIALAVLLALRSGKKKPPGPPVGPQFGYGPNF